MSLNLQGQQFSVILDVAIFSIKTFKISLNLQGQYFKAISAILPAWNNVSGLRFVSKVNDLYL